MKTLNRILYIIAGYAIGFAIGYCILGPLMAHAETCSTAQDSETKTISTEVPAKLQDTVILVVRGTPDNFTVIGAMHSSEFKVVPRKREVLVTKQTLICTAKDPSKLNRVAVLGGQGPTGHLRTKVSGGNAEVESQVGLILGAQYMRQVNNTVSIGVQVQDNESALTVLGFDF